jgi:hypothetical protein
MLMNEEKAFKELMAEVNDMLPYLQMAGNIFPSELLHVHKLKYSFRYCFCIKIVREKDTA